MDRYAVIDFETTGLSVNSGDRAIEIGAVIVENGRIVDEYQNLINPGVHVPANITRLTGISTEMVGMAPPPEVVFPEVRKFVSGSMLVAHNASFDRGFWNFELNRLGDPCDARFLCTMLVARRLYPWSNNHKLATLANVHELPIDGRLHRALADSSLTAHLLRKMIKDLDELYPERAIDSRFLTRYQKTRKIDARSKPPSRVHSKAPRPETVPSDASKPRPSNPKSPSSDRIWDTPHVKMEPVPHRQTAQNPAQQTEKTPPRNDRSWGWVWWIIVAIGLVVLFG